MDTITISAKTPEEALLKAAIDLGVDHKRIEITMVSEATKGLLGLGAKDAMFEASVRTTESELSDFLPTLFDKMGVACVIDSEPSEEGLDVTLTSSGASTIIGRKGETLQALQYLTNIIENKGRTGENYTRITLDIENYREKRVQALQHMAKTAAAKVQKNSKNYILDPMSSYERRIIHSYLQTIPGIASYSIGEDPNRKIVITTSKES